MTYPMKDAAFKPRATIPRLRETFRDIEVVELPNAKHYFVEDAPDEVADAIRCRFGQPVQKGTDECRASSAD